MTTIRIPVVVCVPEPYIDITPAIAPQIVAASGATARLEALERIVLNRPLVLPPNITVPTILPSGGITHMFVGPALAPAQPAPCVGKDPQCPCQDGDPCHYKDHGATKAMPVRPDAPPVASVPVPAHCQKCGNSGLLRSHGGHNPETMTFDYCDCQHGQHANPKDTPAPDDAAELQGRIDNVLAENATLRAELASMTNRKGDAVAAHGNAEAARMIVSAERDQLRAQVEALNAQFKEQSARHDVCRSDLAAMEEKLTKHMNDNPLTKTDADYLTERLKEAAGLERENKTLRGQVEALTKELEREIRNRDNIVERRKDMVVKAELEKALKERDEAIESHHEEHMLRSEMKAERDKALADLAAMREERDGALEQMDTLPAKLDKALADLAAEKARNDIQEEMIPDQFCDRDHHPIRFWSMGDEGAARTCPACAAKARADAAEKRVAEVQDHVRKAHEQEFGEQDAMSPILDLIRFAYVELARNGAGHRKAAKERDAARADLAAAVGLLRGVKESLDVLRDMKLPMLDGVVGGAFIGTESDIDAFLAKREKKS